MLAMTLTRFNHFGTSVSLPDASLAVFFLGGLYLSKFPKARWVFVALLMEAALVDYYAITVKGMSDWCVTPAYGFLAIAYGVLWFAGKWFAPRHTLTGRNLLGVFVVTAMSTSLAFIISNVSFFLLSGRYAGMSATVYALSVAQYWSSYVGVALIYVASAFSAHMVYILLKGKSLNRPHVA